MHVQTPTTAQHTLALVRGARRVATAALVTLGLATANAAPLSITLPQESAQLKPSTLPGHPSASGYCVMCHSVDYINSQPPMPGAFWQAEVTKMVKVYGAPIPPEQIELIADYLAKTYGKDANGK